MPRAMKEITVFRWWVYDEATGEHRPSSRRMSVEEARRVHPGAQPVPGSRRRRLDDERLLAPKGGAARARRAGRRSGDA